MRRTIRLSLVLVTMLIATVSFSSCSEKYDDTAILERLDKLEGTTINTINGQIIAINNTIKDLEAFDSIFEAYTKHTIDSIQLDLRNYIDTNLSIATDWCSSTFATLEEYNKTVTELVLLENRVTIMDSTYNDTIKALNNKIEQTIIGMREWVNSCFTNYYDIAQVDAKLFFLESKVDSLDSTSKAGITQLRTDLDTTKNVLTRAYTKAIKSAIETNNGTINTRISNEITSVNTCIDNEVNTLNLRLASLEGRVSALEEQVNKLSKQLGILFSDNNISCSPGDVVIIDYTIINGTDSTTVYALPSNGYKAKVIPATKSIGSIKVTVPNPIEDCSILIFVNNADRTVLKSLNFMSGTMSISAEAIMADADGGDVSVDLSTDLQYTVKVPAEATWVHYNNFSTKSVMRNETLNFTVDENNTPNIRSAIVELVNGSDLTIGSVTIRQSANVMQSNEIWYKTSNGQTIELSRPYAFGANIVSNAYGKKGVITFDGPVTKIGPEAFQNCSTLTSISIPRGPVSIGDNAFNSCSSLKDISLPNSITTIGNDAFNGAFYGASITLPDSLISIGSEAFSSTNIVDIVFPATLQSIGSRAFIGLKDRHIQLPDSLISIGSQAFACSFIEDITIPSSVKTIGSQAFIGCSELKHANILASVSIIQSGLFSECEKLESVIFPSSVNQIYNEVFSGCSKLEEITINSSVIFGSNALSGCNNIKTLNYFGYPCLFDRNTVFGSDYIEGISLCVPKGMKQKFEDANWVEFKSIEEVDSIVVTLPEAVDLGLSVKWASFNLGAKKPEQYGMFLAWGELYPKTNYNQDCKYYNQGNYLKYNQTDGLKDLEKVDDAANYYLGGSWHIPTKDEQDELMNKCTWTWATQNGVNGYLVTSKIPGYTDHSIFLPSAGERFYSFGTGLADGNFGGYWTSTLGSSIEFCSDYVKYYGRSRFYGLSVRPVCTSEEWLSSKI